MFVKFLNAAVFAGTPLLFGTTGEMMNEKATKPKVDMAEYENLFSKYSINKLYVLNFLGEKERAFVEGMNDYDIIKTFELYNKNSTGFDDTYIGILKKVKE
jgi:hypothetical protein